MSRRDVLKSWLRSVTSSATAPLRRLPTTQTLTRVLAELQHRRVSISDARLTAAAGRAPSVHAVTICAAADSLRIELVDAEGQELSATLVPHRVRFAPRGAKELTLRIVPADMARHSVIRDVVGALAHEIAVAVWGPLLRRGPRKHYTPYVHHDGDLLGIDLRDLPIVRSSLSHGLGATLLDFIDVARIGAETGKLVLHLRLPGLTG